MFNFTLIPNRSLTVITSNNEVLTTRSDNPNWDKLIEAVKTEDEAEVIRLINLKQTVTTFADNTNVGPGNITVENGVVAYKGMPLHGLDVDRVLSFVQLGVSRVGMVRFLENKMRNPSARSIASLYEFLETKGEGSMPVTPNGTFIGYKGVNADYSSKNTGQEPLLKGTRLTNGAIDNSVGQEIRMERNFVSDDFNQGCAAGLHVGSLRYASNWAVPGGRVVLVEVNPADVVSVPSAECEKLRCCAYKVIGLYTGPLPETYTDAYTPVVDDYSDDLDEDLDQELDSDEDNDLDGDGYDDGEETEGDECPICGEDHDESDCPDNVDSEPNSDDYDAGYADGEAEGKSDAEARLERQNTVPAEDDDDWQAGWNDGYNAGYDENDTI